MTFNSFCHSLKNYERMKNNTKSMPREKLFSSLCYDTFKGLLLKEIGCADLTQKIMKIKSEKKFAYLWRCAVNIPLCEVEQFSSEGKYVVIVFFRGIICRNYIHLFFGFQQYSIFFLTSRLKIVFTEPYSSQMCASWLLSWYHPELQLADKVERICTCCQYNAWSFAAEDLLCYFHLFFGIHQYCIFF